MESYIHQSPGRLRIRSIVFKNDAERAHSLTEELIQWQGIHSVRVNATTGSMVIRFDPRLVLSSRLVAFFAKRDVFQDVVRIAHRKPWKVLLELSPTEKKALLFCGKLLLSFALHKAGAKRTRALLSAIL